MKDLSFNFYITLYPFVFSTISFLTQKNKVFMICIDLEFSEIVSVGNIVFNDCLRGGV